MPRRPICGALADDGDTCILWAGHPGCHMHMPCSGVCDDCDCLFAENLNDTDDEDEDDGDTE